jgi:exonuclease VII small subunit
MTENNEYNATPEVTPTPEEQAVTKRGELIQDLKSLDYGYRYLDFEHSYQVLEQTVKVIKGKQESLKKAREVVQEFLSTLDEDSDLSSELITMFSDLEDPLSLDLEVMEEAEVEATLTVYYYRKPWEKNLPLDSSDISISVEGNYGFYISDYSVDHVSVN